MTLLLRLNTAAMLDSGNAAQVAAAEAVAPVTGHNLDNSEIRAHKDVLWHPGLEAVIDLGDMPNGQQVAVLNGVLILHDMVMAKLNAIKAKVDAL